MTGRVGPSVGRVDILDQLLDFTTQNYYPQVQLCVSSTYMYVSAKKSVFVYEILTLSHCGKIVPLKYHSGSFNSRFY